MIAAALRYPVLIRLLWNPSPPPHCSRHWLRSAATTGCFSLVRPPSPPGPACSPSLPAPSRADSSSPLPPLSYLTCLLLVLLSSHPSFTDSHSLPSLLLPLFSSSLLPPRLLLRLLHTSCSSTHRPPPYSHLNNSPSTHLISQDGSALAGDSIERFSILSALRSALLPIPPLCPLALLSSRVSPRFPNGQRGKLLSCCDLERFHLNSNRRGCLEHLSS